MVAITAVVDADNARVLVQVSGASGSTGEILRVTAAGATAPIRNADPATWTSGAWVDYDYEAPLDEAVYYIVTASQTSTTPLATSATIQVPSNGNTWLKHPGNPSLNMIIDVASLPQFTYDIPQGVFNVIGSKYPVVVSSTRFAAAGDMTVGTQSTAERTNLLNLVADGSTLLLQAPLNYGVGSVYVAIGSVTEARVDSAPAYVTWRNWTLPLTIVDVPVGLAAAGAGNTWGDVYNTSGGGAYTTWSAVMAAKKSWTELLQRVADDV